MSFEIIAMKYLMEYNQA